MLSCLALLGCAAAAPQDPTPVAIVQPFEPLIGSWRGEGTLVASPGDAERRWTATAEVRWILGGHFAQEDLEAVLGDGTPLQARTLFGWDGGRDRFVAATVANDGRSRISEVVWSGHGTLVATTIDVVDGQPALQRTVWEFGDGKYGFRMERAVGIGAWHVVVNGEFVRHASPGWQRDEVARSDVGAEMVRVAAMVGEYSVEGERFDADGRTLARASGTDRVRTMFGGHVLLAKTALGTEESRLEAHRYLAWNAADGRYDVMSFDARGGIGATQLRWDGEDALTGEVVESDGVERMLASTLVELGRNGIESVQTRTLRATGETVDRVALRYRRTEGPR